MNKRFTVIYPSKGTMLLVINPDMDTRAVIMLLRSWDVTVDEPIVSYLATAESGAIHQMRLTASDPFERYDLLIVRQAA